jgi:hypothetical protein
MTEEILRKYWLFTAACTIIGSVVTIFIFKYHAIVAYLNRKITFILKQDARLLNLHEVMKELQLRHPVRMSMADDDEVAILSSLRAGSIASHLALV